MTVSAYTCKLEYRLECSKCATFVKEPVTLYSGSVVPLPTLPTGWRCIEGRVYCGGHKVTVLIEP